MLFMLFVLFVVLVVSASAIVVGVSTVWAVTISMAIIFVVISARVAASSVVVGA
jgi:hypothetical protein